MVRFEKYQGTGNDFILVDNRDSGFQPGTEEIARLCHRRYGIGADGLILLEESADLDFRMVYYNSDGRESSMCGNGGRCVARFANKLGICGQFGSFQAIDGRHDFEIADTGNVKLKMGDVNSIETKADAFIMDTGSPHYVVLTEGVREIDIVTAARKVRYNDRFKNDGINVNYVEDRGANSFMRTYERGVEGETLSCGTGTVAAALSLAVSRGKKTGPIEINTPGGKLCVHFEQIDAGFSDIWLSGPAEKVFEGTFLPQ